MRGRRIAVVLLVGVCCVLGGLATAHAEPLVLAEEMLVVDMPSDWQIVHLLEDERVSVYALDGAGAPMHLYVFRMDGAAGSATSKKNVDQALRDFLSAEKTLDFAPRGSARATIAGRPAKSYTHKDGDLLTRVTTWVDASETRRYVWRVEVRAEKDEQTAVMQRFDGFLVQHVEMLVSPSEETTRDDTTASPGTALAPTPTALGASGTVK